VSPNTEMVREHVPARAIAISLKPSVEDQILESVNAVFAGASIILSSIVLLVVRLIIGGRVAVGGFARS
jgi:hypothetical protein